VHPRRPDKIVALAATHECMGGAYKQHFGAARIETDQWLYVLPISIIRIINWIDLAQCSMIDLSPLFSSTGNRFSPLPQRAFFCSCAVCGTAGQKLAGWI